MLIIHSDGTIQQVEDLPDYYQSPEWQAYEAASIEQEQSGDFQWTPELSSLYNAYKDAQQEHFKK